MKIFWMAFLAVSVTCAISTAAEPEPNSFYMVRIVVNEPVPTDENPDAFKQMFSQSTLARSGELAHCMMGMETKVGDQTVDTGHLWRFTARPAENGLIHLEGCVEISSFVRRSQDLVEVEGRRLYFVKDLKPGKVTRLPTKKKQGAWIELTIEEAPSSGDSPPTTRPNMR